MAVRVDENLCSAGFRPTRQRRAVFEALAAAGPCHPTAEEVFTSVRAVMPHISLATVYKALESLAAAGLAQKFGCGQGSARFDARTDEHYHAVCRRCGAVHDVEPVPAASRALRALGLPLARVDDVRVQFIGECHSCRGKQPPAAPTLDH